MLVGKLQEMAKVPGGEAKENSEHPDSGDKSSKGEALENDGEPKEGNE